MPPAKRPDTESLNDVAWRILSDLMTPDGAFASLAPEALQSLIELRIERESEQLGVSVSDLARAFERAMTDLTGSARPAPGTPDL